MAQETVNTQASSNPWPEMLDMKDPCMGATPVNLSEYPRLVPLIEVFLDPETPEPLHEALQFRYPSSATQATP